jgi:hypothetical protein
MSEKGRDFLVIEFAKKSQEMETPNIPKATFKTLVRKFDIDLTRERTRWLKYRLP